MAIIIPHRFSDKLNLIDEYKKINFLVIGTFNPGSPIRDSLTEEEKEAFDLISTTKEYLKKLELLNFYDRPNNRFWGTIDRIYFSKYYKEQQENFKRPEGLKPFSNVGDRLSTYKTQVDFLIKNNLFITDLIKELKPLTFDGIYNRFYDTVLDKYVSEWNTNSILEIIKLYKPKVLFTFAKSKDIPNISIQVKKIVDAHPNNTYFLMSPSGNAKKSYDTLVKNWAQHFG
jgi:hypothetical protein